MSFTDLYDSGEHSKNVAHFASLVHLASSDGELNEEEIALLERFKRKLDIRDSEYKEIIENPKMYPIDPPTSSERRLERLFNLFQIIYADHQIDEAERKLLNRYARGLGYTDEAAEVIIKKSIKIFGGNLDFEDYQYLIVK
ncbi:TerB family tellurite resistance protein [Dokdonia sinensis]|uniref:TerB family tellurite resistance protein n=1 Tax=Dokdonia sinensis TaxID=2479847 RepID=A0A3M0GNQ1_9FLAO|nr:TerB family tellurite resistance protein [Dokdonia sinensis]RMB62839.1 TerB family tellurite resistance protein [Dokdonia sinensis]